MVGAQRGRGGADSCFTSFLNLRAQHSHPRQGQNISIRTCTRTPPQLLFHQTIYVSAGLLLTKKKQIRIVPALPPQLIVQPPSQSKGGGRPVPVDQNRHDGIVKHLPEIGLPVRSKEWWMVDVIFVEGGARNPDVPILFQVADVDFELVRWVNADLVPHIVHRV